ncbi:ABC transporter substrate-binding protein [Bacillus horti]|uniref:Iron(III) transport system substrate-binding protein n=1 Tax=Caldalkalibacillus horti TaxID=77523 RepID=A0ABT9W556_9BACI|nr:ABC transporter substrate-binding protein [Bacillus horti]MDQ0168384.1 iron(III) transport system substrate-binding protein [Bacillus horti]
MKKLLVWLSVMTAVLVLVAGCGSSTGTDSGASNKLSVYSPHQAEIINPIIKEFQDRTGIEVDLVTGGTGELLNRVQAETSNPLGDVFWGGGAESLEAFSSSFEPYVSSEDANIPAEYKSPNNYWTGFSALPMVIMYNKNMISEDEVPTSWEELLDPKFKGLIAFCDPARSGSSYTQLVTMLFAQDNVDKGWEYVENFVANLDGKLLSGSSMVFRGVADGEFPIGVTLEEAAHRYIAGGSPVGVHYPAEGTSTVPDGMAIIKDAKNMENAQKFIDFLAGKDVQELIVKEFNRRSIRDDVNPPEGLAATEEIPVVDYDFSWSAENKDEVLNKFLDIVIKQ